MPPTPPPLTPPVTAGSQLDRLVALMQILRSPDGCPWDREQTLESLKPFVLEEAYEVVEALETDDRVALRDELGDHVFEAVFVAQLCAEAGDFTLADSLASIAEKLIRRHPHVFPAADGETDGDVKSSDDVKRRWEAIKAEERQDAGREHGLLRGIPRALPALLRAYRIGKRVATVGFDWPDLEAVLAKVEEERRELGATLTETDANAADRREEELGDLLFAVVNLARHLGVEPEGALRRANDKFTRRFDAVEARLSADGRALSDVPLEEMDATWDAVKAAERRPATD